MEGTGMSLFQGGGSIHLNNSVQDRLEEEEQLADEKRRRKELDEVLENAFDDLVDDDDISVNNSTHFTSMNLTKHQPELDNQGGILRNLAVEMKGNGVYNCRNEEIPRLVVNGHNHQYTPRQDHQIMHNGHDPKGTIEFEKLKMMYEMRVKECQQLADQVANQERNTSAETNSLRARLEIACTERERAELSLQQAQHELANSKHMIIELEARCTELLSRLEAKEQDMNTLKLEMHATAESFREAQRRLQSQQTKVYDTDAMFRDQQDRFKEEIDRLHQDLEKTRKRLDDKENELKRSENRCLDMERSKEELLLEKTAHINRLMSELDVAQSGARNREKSAQLIADKKTAMEQVKELGNKLEATARELAMARDELKQWHQLLAFDANNSTSSASPSNKIASLKNQLSQAKQMKQKIGSLSAEISKRDENIETLKKSEQLLKSKIENQQSVEVHLNSKLSILQNKVDLLSGAGDGNAELIRENERLSSNVDEATRRLKEVELKLAESEAELENLKSEQSHKKCIELEANSALRSELESLTTKHKQVVDDNSQLKVLYLQVCKTKDTLKRENTDLSVKVNSLSTDLEIAKSRYDEKDYQLLKTANAELTEKLEAKNKEIEQVASSKELLAKDVEVCDELRKTIDTLTGEVKELKLKLELQKENETIIKDLRIKAESFEQYIIERYRSMQTRCDKQTNTDADVTCQMICQPNCQFENEKDQDSDSDSALMVKEARIRQEIAAQFASQLKCVENKHHEKLCIIETQHQLNMSSLKELLEKKSNEVETLRNLILAEREKIGDMMKLRAQQMDSLVEDNKKLRCETQELREKFVLYGELRNQLEKCQNKIVKLKSELQSATRELQSERDSNSNAIQELMQRLKEFEQKSHRAEKELSELREKYRNAKKLVHGLKEYANDKDKHTNEELKRIEEQYEGTINRLQSKLQQALTSREQQVSDKLSKIESDFDAKLSRLKEKR